MAGFNDYMTNYFNRASQGAVPPSQPLRAVPGVGFGYNEPPGTAAVTFGGDASGKFIDTFAPGGAFADTKVGGTVHQRSFDITRGPGGMEIISGNMRTPAEQAALASARLTGVQADLLPGSTAADIANVNSQVSNRNALTGEIHADAVSNRLTQGAQRGLIGAQVGLTGAQTSEQRSATTSRDLGVWTDPANGDQYQRDSATGRLFKLKGLGMLDSGPR